MASFTINRFQGLGNLTRDAELRYLQSGQPVLEFSIAINTRVKDGDEWKDGKPFFMEFSYWGKPAENIASLMVKGRPVYAEGVLKLDEWEDKETGAKRSKVRCTAEVVVPKEREERREESKPAQKAAGKPAARQPAKAASAGLDDEPGF